MADASPTIKRVNKASIFFMIIGVKLIFNLAAGCQNTLNTFPFLVLDASSASALFLPDNTHYEFRTAK
jgi:hypothetical protein